MDNIILGLLMIKPMTGYEIRIYIKTYFSMMCSDSAGSFQVALQKLQGSGLIECDEYVEKGVNKKMYTITDIGRKQFFTWEAQPMNHKKAKNLELAKLFFLGMLDIKKRSPLLSRYVQELLAEKQLFVELKKDINQSIVPQYEQLSENAKSMDMYKYQMMTLDYGIAAIEFEIHWYSKIIADNQSK